MAVKKAANQGGSTAPGRHNNNSSRPHLLTLNTQTKKSKKHMSRFHASPPHLIQLAKLFHLLRNPVFLELQHLARFAKSNKYHEEKEFPQIEIEKATSATGSIRVLLLDAGKFLARRRRKRRKGGKYFHHCLVFAQFFTTSTLCLRNFDVEGCLVTIFGWSSDNLLTAAIF